MSRVCGLSPSCSSSPTTPACRSGSGFLGVDVFFVISGFLITGLLVRELDGTGTISWGRFVARRIRRLLPAAVLVLAVTGASPGSSCPACGASRIGADIAGAALYVVNWVFAHRAVDYLAPTSGPRRSSTSGRWPWRSSSTSCGRWRSSRSPGCSGGSAAGVAGPSRRVLASIAVPSFGYAVWLGHVDPARSYFVTTTRAWELGIGAALALAVAPGGSRAGRPPSPLGSGRRLGRSRRRSSAPRRPAPAGATGPAPGPSSRPSAPLPCSPPALARAARGPGRLLGTAPMVWVGGLSYSLYLWHWPALVLTEWALDGLDRPQAGGLVVLLAVRARLASHRFLEQPVHHSRARGRRTRPGARRSVPPCPRPAPLPRCPLPRPPRPSAPRRRRRPTGAREPRSRDADDAAEPDPAVRRRRLGLAHPRPPASPGRTARPPTSTAARSTGSTRRPVPCEFGVPQRPTTIALVGDSKAMQWLPALQDRRPPAAGGS